MASFLVRLWLPIDWSFRPLNLQFPFFARYIALFVVGLVAYRRNWMARLEPGQARLWLGIAVGAAVLFPVLALLGGAAKDDSVFKGGWHWQAFGYALWESFVCMGACIGLIHLFRRHADGQGKVARFFSANAYSAYLIHEPVIIAAALAVQGVALYPLIKWAGVALVALPLCFVLGHLLRKLPHADRVL